MRPARTSPDHARAGNEHHLLATSGAAQNLLDEGVLRRRPDDAAPHRPEVDDVADQEDILRTVVPQKIHQPVCLASARTEVDVREKDGTYGGHASHVAGAV